MEKYILGCQTELKQLIRDLCAIPAPSHHEGRRAEFCQAWFREHCGAEAYIDEALNAICPWSDSGSNTLIVCMAHTDTVFPDMEPLPFSEEGGKMYCPGVTDDTANLAVLMICARYVMQHMQPGNTGFLFVANSCEEGLGNLKGTRSIFSRYGSRIRELITLDGTDLRAIVTDAVGSHRYRVSVRTEGGHSFGDFGKQNAIHSLSSLISALYAIPVPVEGNSKTTYNVGMISGGTSVNTIAQQAEMLYEYRSDNLSCMKKMEDIFHYTIDIFRKAGTDIEVERIGERPCSDISASAAQKALVERACAAIREVLKQEAVCSSGSTDANIPLSLGIPAICISACNGAKCHTREEWLDVGSLPDGCRLFMEILAGYLK
ncbi:MAG: M20/M25/M40 family metallo-hydrolase [Clostridia bacterium]|nr:M20/M25/M40 family metallo-hydrolase [Clostridia bacterium]